MVVLFLEYSNLSSGVVCVSHFCSVVLLRYAKTSSLCGDMKDILMLLNVKLSTCSRVSLGIVHKISQDKLLLFV